MRCGNGGVLRRPSPRPDVRRPRSRRPADVARIRPPLCQGAQERRSRRRGDRGSSDAAYDGFRRPHYDAVMRISGDAPTGGPILNRGAKAIVQRRAAAASGRRPQVEHRRDARASARRSPRLRPRLRASPPMPTATPKHLSASGNPLPALRVLPRRAIRYRGYRWRSFSRRPGRAFAIRAAPCNSVKSVQPLSNRIRERLRLPFGERVPRPSLHQGVLRKSPERSAKIRRSEIVSKRHKTSAMGRNALRRIGAKAASRRGSVCPVEQEELS